MSNYSGTVSNYSGLVSNTSEVQNLLLGTKSTVRYKIYYVVILKGATVDNQLKLVID